MPIANRHGNNISQTGRHGRLPCHVVTKIGIPPPAYDSAIGFESGDGAVIPNADRDHSRQASRNIALPILVASPRDDRSIRLQGE